MISIILVLMAVVLIVGLISTQCMLQGYPFHGTGEAAPTADNVTFYDPILETDVSLITPRGKVDEVRIEGISFASDAIGLGSRLELRIGNQVTPARVIKLPPILDADLVTANISIPNYFDLGGIMVGEDETIDIRLIDPGAAELMAGVLWVEDGEPETAIPNGQLITLKCGGTNDAGTTLATTGFDADSVKLVNERLYTPFMSIVRPEDKVVESIIIRAGKDSMTLPPIGTMVYPSVPLQFTGREWNNGSVVGKVQVQAAAKVEIWLFCIESEGATRASPTSPKIDPIKSNPIVNTVALSQVVNGGSGGSRLTLLGRR